MTTWTEENTEGFTKEELATLNAAQTALEAENPSIDTQNIADRLNNAWMPGITVEALIKAASI